NELCLDARRILGARARDDDAQTIVATRQERLRDRGRPTDGLANVRLSGVEQCVLMPPVGPALAWPWRWLQSRFERHRAAFEGSNATRGVAFCGRWAVARRQGRRPQTKRRLA